MTDHHDDPAADAAARAAQLVAMTLSITESLARLRTERLAGRAADDERYAGAVRAQHRADVAAAWLARKAGACDPSGIGLPHPLPPSQAGPVAVTIVCSPRDLAERAFPVAIADAMATAPQAARDAVRVPGSPLNTAGRGLTQRAMAPSSHTGAAQQTGGR
jgi:hypothetical protein